MCSGHAGRIGRPSAVTVTCLAMSMAGSALAQQRTSVHVDVGSVHVGVNVATRGPVHEAYAEPVMFDAEPGLVAPQAPPPPIEEAIPDERPEGEDVDWVPGYWSWDDEANSHIWVSGIWRSLPPGRAFVPGYWSQVSGGHQWVSGFWMKAEYQHIEYLPPPPAPVSVEPVGVAPAPDHIWVPGAWLWRSGRSAWRQGYWLAPQVDWVWVPSHYVWTPSGYVFVPGYWDYVVTRRGLLFAPVHVERAVLARPGFVYTPTVVINANVLVGNLFARPRYRHYYFGDYFAAEYTRAGIVPIYEFHRSRRGYSSIYAHRLSVERRRDARWEDNLIRQYEMRRARPETRPPRTWVELERARSRRPLFPDTSTRQNLSLAGALKDSSTHRELPVRLQPTSQTSREESRRRVSDLRTFREHRKTAEIDSVSRSPLRAGRGVRTGDEQAGAQGRNGRTAPRVRQGTDQAEQPTAQPLRLTLPRSPIVGRPVRGSNESRGTPDRGAPRREPQRDGQRPRG